RGLSRGVAAQDRAARNAGGYGGGSGGSSGRGIVSQQFTAFTIPTALMYYTTLALIVALAPAISPSASYRPPRVAWAPAAITAGAALACVYLALRFGIADHALALAGRGLESGDVAQASAQYAVY